MIYLDYQASTALAPEARDAMLPWLGGPDSAAFGNPHSPHVLGRQAAAAVALARERVAALLPAGGTLIFTGSAVEAINLAMRGSAPLGDKRPLAVSAIEHVAVLETAQALGCPVTTIPVSRDGIAQTDCALAPGTRMIALMQVNNEIGTIQPTIDMARRARDMGALLLVDAVQAAGKMALDEADLIAISAHKIHGPKGIGALWVRDGIALEPILTGGGQEAGIRSGTLSPALCAGFGAAAQVALERRQSDAAHAAELWDLARELFADWTLNGSADARWHGNLNIRRDGLDVARLMSDCRDICFSAGSACSSGSGKVSHVLRAIGLDDKQAKSSIRLGFGRYTTPDEIGEAARKIKAAAAAQGV